MKCFRRETLTSELDLKKRKIKHRMPREGKKKKNKKKKKKKIFTA